MEAKRPRVASSDHRRRRALHQTALGDHAVDDLWLRRGHGPRGSYESKYIERLIKENVAGALQAPSSRHKVEELRCMTQLGGWSLDRLAG